MTDSRKTSHKSATQTTEICANIRSSRSSVPMQWAFRDKYVTFTGLDQDSSLKMDVKKLAPIQGAREFNDGFHSLRAEVRDEGSFQLPSSV